MPNLNEYLQLTQLLMRDARQDLLIPADLITFINRARREIAMKTQCLRVLTPITGAVITASVVAAGTGYSNSPTITLTAPDFPSGQGPFPSGDQATAAAIVQGGTIAAVDITYGGAGYFQPTASVTDVTGTGASVTVSVSALNQLNQGQEVYNFADVDLSPFPGVESIFAIKSVSILFSNFRYSLSCYSFSTYQALIRQWAQQWQYVPAVCAQYGQGVAGSFYMYPIPSQAYQMEWDCFCLPSDLTTNDSDEALPMPWTEAVPYYSAYLSFLSLMNFNAAKFYLEQFDMFCNRYSTYARPGRAVSMYGRY